MRQHHSSVLSVFFIHLTVLETVMRTHDACTSVVRDFIEDLKISLTKSSYASCSITVDNIFVMLTFAVDAVGIVH